MGRCCVCVVMSILTGSMAVSGCTSDSERSTHHTGLPVGRMQLIGEPDFDWYLSGDRRVAPLQVFSDDWRVWLQWHPGQPQPSILVLEQGGWQVALPRQHGKFSVLDGQWQQLRFQGGALRADARHGRQHKLQDSRARSHASATQSSSANTGATNPIHTPVVAQQLERLNVQLEDRTIRQTLIRWARDHQWRFDNSHWSVAVDLPVTAPATFEGDFIAAVRALLSATDISGRPLQPCFYANRVLRVISANESCDPTGRSGDST